MATFTGTSTANTLSAAAGTLNGFSGGTLAELQDFVGDLIQGEAGDDVITAGQGADTVFGGSGNDTLRGGTSPSLQTDKLFGDDGNDQLFGDGTYLNLYGGAGNDRLQANHIFGENEGGAGADRIIGTGAVLASSLSYRGSGAGVVVNLQTNAASGGDAQGDVISGFRRCHRVGLWRQAHGGSRQRRFAGAGRQRHADGCGRRRQAGRRRRQ